MGGFILYKHMNQEEIKNQIKNTFEKAYGKKLTDAEIAEIIINLSGFFKTLSEFKKSDQQHGN